MNISKNGIPVQQPGRTRNNKKREPLEYALDMIEYYMVIDGVEHTVTVPKISHLRQTMKNEGWRVKKC